MSEDKQQTERNHKQDTNSTSVLSRLVSLSTVSSTNVTNTECIDIPCTQTLLTWLIRYLIRDPRLLESLPRFILPGKTRAVIEGEKIVRYNNVHEACWITLEYLRSLIDGNGVYVDWPFSIKIKRKV